MLLYIVAAVVSAIIWIRTLSFDSTDAPQALFRPKLALKPGPRHRRRHAGCYPRTPELPLSALAAIATHGRDVHGRAQHQLRWLVTHPVC